MKHIPTTRVAVAVLLGLASCSQDKTEWVSTTFDSPWTIQAVPAAQPGPQGDRRAKVIVDNDLSGDPDGLFALAQQVLCESVDLRGIIGAHVGGGGGPMGRGDQAAVSVQKAKDLS